MGRPTTGRLLASLRWHRCDRLPTPWDSAGTRKPQTPKTLNPNPRLSDMCCLCKLVERRSICRTSGCAEYRCWHLRASTLSACSSGASKNDTWDPWRASPGTPLNPIHKTPWSARSETKLNQLIRIEPTELPNTDMEVDQNYGPFGVCVIIYFFPYGLRDQ